MIRDGGVVGYDKVLGLNKYSRKYIKTVRIEGKHTSSGCFLFKVKEMILQK